MALSSVPSELLQHQDGSTACKFIAMQLAPAAQNSVASGQVCTTDFLAAALAAVIQHRRS